VVSIERKESTGRPKTAPEMVTLYVKVLPSQKAWLQNKANDERRTMSEVVRDMLDQAKRYSL